MKYILTSKQFKGEMVFIFNSRNRLVFFDLRAELSEEQHDFFMTWLPKTISGLDKFRTPTSTIKQVEPDLSFESFWSEYNYKEGTKKRAEGLWNRLSRINRILAIEFIRVYDGKLAQAGTAKLYPETYLFNQRWLTNE